ncbi:MAG: dienelactone hydrolase family protein [Myxococcales bacterium]|nr:dienelactone hydrolase family protein [Myxococcales bacterium]
MAWWLVWLACGDTTNTPEEQAPPEEAAEGDAADVPMAPVAPGLLTEAEFAALHELTDDEAPQPKGSTVQIAGMDAYLSLPESATGPVPGVVVIHEWWGLNGHIKHWADRLASAGYAAVAVDLYDGAVATDHKQAMAAMEKVDEATAIDKLKAAHAYLVSDPRIQAPKTASVGWCFGGGYSLRLAMAEPELDASVVYYGRLVDEDAQLQSIAAPMLGIFGSEDAGIPVDTVKAFETRMQGLGKPFTVHLYDAGHAFANPSSGRYHSESANDAWAKVHAFLAEHLAG